MCADPAALLQRAAHVCNGRGSCLLFASPRGAGQRQLDNLCSNYGGCDFLCPEASEDCDGPSVKAIVQYR